MANYTKSTNFATKDSLNSGNPLKIVKGTEIDTEFNNIQTAIATKADTGGILAVASGGTGATTAAAARASLLPAFASNVGKVLAVNSSATDVEFVAAGGVGTVTSVGGTGTVNGISLSGTVTASGNLTLGGTLNVSSPTGVLPLANGGTGSASGLSLTTGVTGILPVANGGTGSASGVAASIITGTLPVANGGTGSASGVPAAIVLAGTLSTGAYVFGSTSTLQLGPISPSASHRFTSTAIDTHPAATFNMGSNVLSLGIVVTDQVAGSSSRNLVSFATGTFPGSPYASITTNGTTVTYGTGSDYRLKANVQPLTNSIVKIKALKPCSYTWIKAPDLQSQGFLAHELAEVIPQAVIGEKDAVNADGSIKSQQVDLSYVVPLLTAALQEAIASIEALEVRIAALESN